MQRMDDTTQAITHPRESTYTSPLCTARNSDSDTESVFLSHILSRSGSMQSLDRKGSARSFSITAALSSASSASDSDSTSSDNGSGRSRLRDGARIRSPAGSNVIPLRFALEFAQSFTRSWPKTIHHTDGTVLSTSDVQSLAPALQLTVTLARVLHANAAYLHHLLNTRAPVPDTTVRTDRANKWRKQLQTIRSVGRFHLDSCFHASLIMALQFICYTVVYWLIFRCSVSTVLSLSLSVCLYCIIGPVLLLVVLNL
ncbi:unnamed protein product [Echinostoma caproni]|uniref:Transmembrane protein n=1 Tax=Echinostoma caproni TaxID=27848 RepID=A0A183A338_9TREM|nr:unnamed protein product [Echinostoma caproni]